MNSGAVLLWMWGIGLSSLLVLWLVVSSRRGGGRAQAPTWSPGLGGAGTPERPFVPTVSGPGIAIDDVHGWLWVATEDNGYQLIDQARIQGWRHEWTERSDNAGKLEFWHNRLVVRLKDLQTPVVKVAFGRDYDVAEQWKGRLSAWLNG